MSIYSRLTKKEDEEDELTPSQKARIEQKSKSDSIYSRLTAKPVKEEPLEPEKKPSLIQKAIRKVKEKAPGVISEAKKFLLGKRKIISPIPKEKPEGFRGNWPEDVASIHKARQEAVVELEEAERVRREYYAGKVRQVDPALDQRVNAAKWAIRDYDVWLDKEPSNRGLLKNISESWQRKEPLNNWYRGMSETKMGKAVMKYQQGEELDKKEQALVNAYRASGLRGRDIKKGASEIFADFVVDLVGFGVNLAASGRIVQPTTTAVATGLSMKLPGELLKKVAPKLVNNSVKLAVASQINFPEIERKTAEYMLPTIDYEESLEGKDILNYVKEGDPREKAERKARINNLINYVSEGLGGYIDDALPFVKKAFIGRWLTKNNIPVDVPNLVKKALSKISFTSLVGEIIEEEIAEPFLSTNEERQYYAPFFTPEGRERVLTEFLLLGGFSGIARVSDVVLNTAIGRQKKNNDKIGFTPTKEKITVEEEVELPPVVKKEIEKRKAKPAEVSVVKKAAKYTSAADFAEAEYSAKPTDQIGKMDVRQVIPRDKVEEAGVRSYEERIKAGEEIDPIEIVRDGSVITTVEGSHRLVAYQRLDKKAPVIFRGEGEIKGLETLEDVYKKAVTLVKDEAGEIKSIQKIISKSGQAFVDVLDGKPLADVKSLSKQEMKVLREFNSYVAKPEVYAKYEAGAKDVEIIKDFLSQRKATKPPTKVSTEEVKRLNEIFIADEIRQANSRVSRRATSTTPIKASPEAVAAWNKLRELGYRLKSAQQSTLGFDISQKTTVAKKPTKKPKKAAKKVKKVTPTTKPGAIKPKEIVKPKAKIFKAQERKQIQKETKEVVFSGKDPQEAVGSINKYVKGVLDQADDPLYTRKLKSVRAELKRSMYEMAGAETGNWKRDYAYFQAARRNLEISNVVDEIEESIFKIDDVLNPEKAPKTMGYATTQAKPIGEFEDRKPPKKGTSEFKLFEESKALIQKYARLIGEGYTPRGALGVYYQKTKNIMVNAMNDLSVVAHEITHFLDVTNKISDKLLAIKGFTTNGNPIYDPNTLKYRKEITDLYVKYYGGGRKTHKLRKRALEGFATLLQKYVESPQTITNEYPLLVNNFLKEGGQYYHPVMKEIIKDLNKIVERYQGLSSLEKIGSRITSEDASVDKSDFLNFFEKLRTQLVDAIYPVEVLAKRAKLQFTVNDPSLWLRSYNSVSGIINNNIASDRGYWTLKGNKFVKRHDFNWKTLVDTTEERKITNDFAYYLVARREHFSYLELDKMKKEVLALKKHVKGMTARQARDTISETGQSLFDEVKEAEENYKELKAILDKDGFSRQEVDEAYGENKMRFKEEEQLFDALTRADLELLASEEVQLIKPKQLEELSSKQGYASFKRQFYNELLGDQNEMPAQARVGKTKVSSLLRRKGSMRTIFNPLYSGIANHSEAMRKSLRQVVYNKITTIGTSAAFPNLFQDLDLKVAIDKETGVFHYPQEKDSNIIMGRVGYKRKPILVDRQIKDIIDNILTYKNIEVFTRLYAGLSRMFTAGTTGFYPQFAATNFIRDQITAQANTTNKYKTLFSPLAQFGKLLADKSSQDYKYYQEYLVMGGERQTFTGWQKLPPNRLFQRINGEKKGLKKAIALMEKGTDFASAPSKYSELVTRASEYIKARKAGKPQIVALEEAGRLTAPFHHLGRWGGPRGQNFIRGLPFFNATLQVLDQSIRTAETKEGRKRMAFVTTAITAAYLTSLMALLRADDDQKEQYKDLEAKELANNLYFPHPSGKKLIRIPMSDVFSPLGTIINMIIADDVLKTKYKASDYLAAATSVIPDQFNLIEPVNAFLSWIPQIFQAGAETVMGVKTWPKIQPLESMALKNMPPAMRTNENTSAFAKWLGKKANLSPIKIDYLLTGYFGRAIGFVTGKPSAYDFQSSVVRDYYFSYGRRVSGTYDLKEENDQNYTVYQRGEKDLSKSEVEELYRVKMLTDDFADAMRDYRKVDIEKDQEKASLLRSEALTIINQIDLKEKPKGFNKWVKKAKKRRKEKILEIKKESKKQTLAPMTPKKFLSFSIVRKAYGKETMPILSATQRIRALKIATDLREKNPEWYAKNVGKQGEISMFGHTIGEWPISKKTEESFSGLSQKKPEGKIAETAASSAKENNVDESLVAAILWQESGYEPDAVNDGGENGVDRGIAQINSKWHPEVTDEQAYDPEFAIQWLAKELASLVKYFGGDINKAIAAYNVGRGGVEKNLGQDTPFGGGPKGQTYIDNVARNLTEEQRKKLGLKTSY